MYLQSTFSLLFTERFDLLLVTARKRSLREGYVFAGVCDSVNRGGMRGFIRRACVVLCGGACVVLWGACVVLSGGHAWFYLGERAWFYLGGVHGFIWGACVALFGGACVVLCGGACMVLCRGGMHGFIRGGMCGFFSFFGYNEIRSISGRYACYWNAFL